MCAAILSTIGAGFDARAFLATSTLNKKAEPTDKGFQILVCDDEELQAQVAACVRFIRRHLSELKRLRDAPGIEGIDFRIAYFWDEGVAALAYTLPEELHLMLAHARATLTFCVYPCSKEEPNQPPQTTTGSGAPGRV